MFMVGVFLRKQVGHAQANSATIIFRVATGKAF